MHAYINQPFFFLFRFENINQSYCFPFQLHRRSSSWSDWSCPHIVGGIPLSTVKCQLPVLRDGKAFVSIPGLCD
jgi:hypothetical protein